MKNSMYVIYSSSEGIQKKSEWDWKWVENALWETQKPCRPSLEEDSLSFGNSPFSWPLWPDDLCHPNLLFFCLPTVSQHELRPSFLCSKTLPPHCLHFFFIPVFCCPQFSQEIELGWEESSEKSKMSKAAQAHSCKFAPSILFHPEVSSVMRDWELRFWEISLQHLTVRG